MSNKKISNIDAELIHLNDSNNITVYLHGFKGSKDGDSNKAYQQALTDNKENSLFFTRTGCSIHDKHIFTKQTTTNWLNETYQILDYLEFSGFNNINLIGSSYGGYLALRAAHDKKKIIKKVFLIAPLSDISGLLVGDYDSQISQETIEEIQNIIFTMPEFVKDAKNHTIYDKNIDRLVRIIHGIYDGAVPIKQSENLVKSLDNARLLSLKTDHSCRFKDSYEDQIGLAFDFFNIKKYNLRKIRNGID